MTIEEIKKQITEFRADGDKRKGKPWMGSEACPIGIQGIEHLLSIVEIQEQRIEQLENYLRDQSRSRSQEAIQNIMKNREGR